MISAKLKNRLESLEASKNVKRELPWDCINLMSLYETERARRVIIYKLFDSKGEDCEPLEFYRIEMEDTRELSREAREFLSLSAEIQDKVVDYYHPSKPLTEEEAEELRRDILNRIYGNGALNNSNTNLLEALKR